MRLRDMRRLVETDLRDLQELLNRNRQAPRRDDLLSFDPLSDDCRSEVKQRRVWVTMSWAEPAL
jgi:hypothetical protein